MKPANYGLSLQIALLLSDSDLPEKSSAYLQKNLQEENPGENEVKIPQYLWTKRMLKSLETTRRNPNPHSIIST